MKKTISIDLWGTLIESSYTFRRQSIALILTSSLNLKINLETIEDTKRKVKQTLNYITETTGYQLPNDEIFALFAKKLEINNHLDFMRKYQEIVIDNLPSLINGVDKHLKTLAEKYRLILSSNTMFISGKSLSTALVKLDINKYFDMAYFSDVIGVGKPNELMYGESDFHIGDTKATDYDGPKKYGITPFLLSPTLTFKDVTEILLKI